MSAVHRESRGAAADRVHAAKRKRFARRGHSRNAHAQLHLGIIVTDIRNQFLGGNFRFVAGIAEAIVFSKFGIFPRSEREINLARRATVELSDIHGVGRRRARRIASCIARCIFRRGADRRHRELAWIAHCIGDVAEAAQQFAVLVHHAHQMVAAQRDYREFTACERDHGHRRVYRDGGFERSVSRKNFHRVRAAIGNENSAGGCITVEIHRVLDRCVGYHGIGNLPDASAVLAVNPDDAGRDRQHIIMTSGITLDGFSAATHVWKHPAARMQYGLHALGLRRAIHAGEGERQHERACQDDRS